MKSLFRRLGLDPLVVELDQMGMYFYPFLFVFCISMLAYFLIVPKSVGMLHLIIHVHCFFNVGLEHKNIAILRNS